MINIEMHGRLGNQIFQYAAARSLQEKTNQTIRMSFRQVDGANTEGNKGWENSLRHFRIKKCEYYSINKNFVSLLPFSKKIIIFIYVASYRVFMRDIHLCYKYQLKWCDLLDKIGVRWLANGFYKFKNKECRNYLLNGSFEASQYFDDIRDKLIEEIVPNENQLAKNAELYKIIYDSNAVCLSVRHFELNGKQKNLYDVCTKAYYKAAIDYMKSVLYEPLFIVFSDDIEWAKGVIDLTNIKYVIESEDNPIWEKLRLMYSCKHFIIPNSTFAWWAQYLGRYEKKVVIGPYKWFNNSFESPLIQDTWIKIDSLGNVR